MTQQKTTAQEVYDMLSPIPREQWIVGDYTDEISKCCAVGHVSRLTSNNPSSYSLAVCCEVTGLSRMIRAKSYHFLRDKNNGHCISIAAVNNAPSKLYPQKTCKGRVLALLRDMIKAGF